MSRITKLSVSGIRNFDNEELSSVRFTCPLTLILGPNGSGKTTLIEAIKFATTGEFPPGSDKGKSFIRDINTTCPVKGVVKCQFRDAHGTMYTVCRSIMCTNTGSISRFKTLDSTLTRHEKGTNKVQSISSRCGDINVEMASAIGISKAILNYVIFCHQEDFGWPMEDGKKLKEKFDEIFDSVRYNKALDHLLKQSKEMEQELKVIKAQKNALSAIIEEVEDKEAKLENTKKKLQDVKTGIAMIDEELEPIGQQLCALEKLHSNYKLLENERDKKKMEYEVLKEQITKLQENIHEVFKGSISELMARVELHEESLSTKAREISKFEENLRKIASDEGKLIKAIAEKKVSIGTLNQQIDDQEKRIASRNKILNETLSSWNMKTVDSDASSMEVTTLLEKLENKMDDLKLSVETNRIQRHEEENDSQKNIDKLRTDKSKTESEMNLKNEEIDKTMKEISRIQYQIEEAGTAANKLNVLKAKLQSANKKIDELCESFNVDTVKREIEQEIQEKDSKEVSLSKVEEEIEYLHKHTGLQTELELLKSTFRTREEELNDLVKKHDKSLKAILEVSDIPRVKLKNRIDKIYRDLMDHRQKLIDFIQKEKRVTVSLETTSKHHKSELNKKNLELQSIKEKLSLAPCDYKNFDEALLFQSKKVQDLQDKKGLYVHRRAVYKEYIKQLKEKDPCCPLCRRHFESSYKIKDLVMEMEREIENHPETLKHYESELKEQREKYDSMLQLKPLFEKVIELENVELPKLGKELEKIEKDLEQSQKVIRKKERLNGNLEEKINLFKEVSDDLMIWDRCIEDIIQTQHSIFTLEERITKSGVENLRSISEVQEQRDSLRTSIKDSRDKIEELQAQINHFNEKVRRAREERNSLIEEQLRVQSSMQKLQELQNKLTELNSRQSVLENSVRKLKSELSNRNEELKTAVQQLENMKKKHWKEEEIDRATVAEATTRLFELRKIQKDIHAFELRDVAGTWDKLQSEIQNYETIIETLSRKKQELEKSIKDTKDEINRQEMRKRDLSDNLALRKLQMSAQEIEEQSAEIKRKIENMDYKQKMEQGQKLKTQEESLHRKKNIALGKQEELEETVSQYTKELQKETYRLARKNYMNKCIELTVQSETISNIKVYSRVLDVAMIKYHEERMKTINKIMKHLWKIIYTGNDTSYIEIRANATGGVGQGRRSYNYKLVQMKYGKEMDMRGRCSAGQKVLASIIIRLALAETFCKDCGVIALDEPTTNLDEEHANTLADALNLIVKARSNRQKNFQLIVISHDEKFLRKLALSNQNTGYHELYRKENGVSSIRFNSMCSDSLENRLQEKELLSSEDEEEEESTNDNFKKRKSREDDSYETSTKKRFVCKL